ncbi:MAG: SMI1/KNR4 family protein [Mesorhizobium sp.]|nr:MAG: SMI1/KNR4 family protein [Mesorhizobium sp.]
MNTALGKHAGDLVKLLASKNGFYAFEAALHVFPSESKGNEIGLEDWNSKEGWVKDFEGMASNLFFFAEDIFGSQFCISGNGISVFDPETGNCELLCQNIESWAEIILEDFRVLTGFPLAHSWQRMHGKIRPGTRLIPKVPFVAGGEFAVENLFAIDSVAGMKQRANLAKQIRLLPDGAKIQFKIVD